MTAFSSDGAGSLTDQLHPWEGSWRPSGSTVAWMAMSSRILLDGQREEREERLPMSLQTLLRDSSVERGFPDPQEAKAIHDEQDFHRAVEAYRFFYPTVSMEAIFQGNRDNGVDDGTIAILAATPAHLVLTANSDTPYLSVVLNLRKMGPVVIELPPGPYIGLVNDHNQGWIMDLGLAGPGSGHGCKHLVLPPDYVGDLPEDCPFARSPTFMILLAVRAVPIEGDITGAIEALRRVKVYSLAVPTDVLSAIDVSARKIDMTPLRWEDNLEFWKRLHAVIDSEPFVDALHPMYGELAALGIEKGKPFTPSARTRDVLARAAKAGRDEMRVEAFASERPDRIVWPDRRWEWIGLRPENADFETGGHVDLEARDRWFFQAIITSPAIFRRSAGSGSIYFLAARDANGTYLDGGKTYRLRVPAPVPAALFWSVTAYDAATRSQVRTAQNKAVLGSTHGALPIDDEDIDLYFGPAAPPGKEAQWIQTEPGAGFFLYFRIYGPTNAALDGTWKLDDLELL